MRISMSRTAGAVALSSLLLALLSGCTLTGADEPPLTQVGSIDSGQQPATQEPATQEPPLGLPETPTDAPRIETFLTLTAEAGPFGPGGAGVTPTEMGGGIIPPTAAEGMPTLPSNPATPTVIATPIATPVATSGAVPGTANCPATYTVQPGDTLFRIALRFGLTVNELAAANNITNPALIQAGTVLKIPHCGTSGSGGGSQGAGGERTHVVQPGENLYRIALKYNMSWQTLAAYNGITNPSSIYVGQILRIPPV